MLSSYAVDVERCANSQKVERNMANELKLMCILAHPDDESLGNGGIFAKYAAEGIETHLVTATRGERGWFGEESEHPGLEELGKIRESELHEAATVLGIQSVNFLDYIDGDLDKAHPSRGYRKSRWTPAADQARSRRDIWSIWRIWTPRSRRHFSIHYCCHC